MKYELIINNKSYLIKSNVLSEICFSIACIAMQLNKLGGVGVREAVLIYS